MGRRDNDKPIVRHIGCVGNSERKRYSKSEIEKMIKKLMADKELSKKAQKILEDNEDLSKVSELLQNQVINREDDEIGR